MSNLKRVWASVMASHGSMAYEEVAAILGSAEGPRAIPPPWEDVGAEARAKAKRDRKNAKRPKEAA